MMRAWFGIACLAGWIVTLSCARVPATTYYVLDRGPEIGDRRPVVSTDGPAIGVRAFRVESPYDQDRIVYRVGRQTPAVGFYAYHRWAAPLSRMLPGLVCRAFANSRPLSRIEPAEPGARYDLYVDGQLSRLEELDSDDGTSVRVSMTLILRTADGSELWRGNLDAESPIPAPEVRDLVGEVVGLLERELGRLAGELSIALEGRGAK